MPENTAALFSRREWLERVSTPTLVASFGVGLAGLSRAVAALATASVAAIAFGARTYNIRDHGAVGDGTTLDTAAVQAAIDQCTQDGGGTVLVPAGVFVIGMVELKSNVTLHLAAQGRLLGSGDGANYHTGRGVPPSNGNVVLLSAHAAECAFRSASTGCPAGCGVRSRGGRGGQRVQLTVDHHPLAIREVAAVVPTDIQRMAIGTIAIR